MARKIKLRGTPAQHHSEVESLLARAKKQARGNTCDSLGAALTATSGAIEVARAASSSAQYDRAWKQRVAILKKLAGKSCRYTLQQEGPTKVVRLVPGK